MWMAEWELPVAAVLAKDLDFDQTTPLCLGPALWEWQPWAKESWCDPRWIIQLLQAQSLAAFEGAKSLLREPEEPACGANWAQVQGQLLVPLLLVLSLLNSVPISNSQWMKRNQRGKVSGWDPGWCWAVAWQIQPQGWHKASGVCPSAGDGVQRCSLSIQHILCPKRRPRFNWQQESAWVCAAQG